MILLKLCELFKKDNENFNADKFIKACCEWKTHYQINLNF
jgi:hypothetical protein